MATRFVRWQAAPAVLALFTAVACTDDGALPTAPDANFGQAPTVTVVVCKVGDAATIGNSFTFNTSASTTLGEVVREVSVPAQAAPVTNMGDCRLVWSRPGVGADPRTSVTITEVVPEGFDLTSVEFVTDAGGPRLPAVQDPAGNSVTFVPGRGAIVVFHNVSVAPPPPPPPPPPTGGRIGDRAWLDLNRNGLQDAGEPGLADVVVVLRTTTGAAVAISTSDATGAYSFTGVEPGCYFAEVIAPSGFGITTVDAGDDALDSDVDPATMTTPAVCVSDSEDLTFDFGFVSIG